MIGVPSSGAAANLRPSPGTLTDYTVTLILREKTREPFPTSQMAIMPIRSAGDIKMCSPFACEGAAIAVAGSQHPTHPISGLHEAGPGNSSPSISGPQTAMAEQSLIGMVPHGGPVCKVTPIDNEMVVVLGYP
jgi:hypothetical protein